MAPSCPEEVDVFTVPHSRMKELVCKYLDMLTATNFADVVHLTTLLENLIRTFQEFIAHEQIENQFIMKKLKNKLRSLSIQNTAVCNCHKDNRLTDMLKFLQDGYKCTKKSDADRNNYGLQLRQELEDFTETFLPHMEEEEEVFQPLLMQHFTYEELKQIKATVLQQHFKMETEDSPEKCVADNKSSKPEINIAGSNLNDHVGIENLPDEVMLKIFSHLNPQELCRSAQVSRRWNSLTMDGSLWTALYPVSWAKGDWNAQCGVNEEDSIDVEERLNAKSYDEDADVDETDEWDSEALEIQYQSSMLTCMCKHLLPRVGRTIKHCDLAYSKGLTNGVLYKVLSLCPNLEYLDLTQTRVSDLGFKGFKKEGSGKKLRHLDLSGCLYITDQTLLKLSSALGQVPSHMTETEEQVSDHVTKEGHVTKPNKESANKDEGCPDCKEKIKNESFGYENPTNLESCNVVTCQKQWNTVTSDKDLNKERNRSNEKKCCEKSKRECNVSADGYLSASDCMQGSKCWASKDCDTRKDSVQLYCKNARQNTCGCCCNNKENLLPCNNITEHVTATDEPHDQKFDNEYTESQDRSWIKQTEDNVVERSETINDDLLIQENDQAGEKFDDAQQTCTRRQDEKNIRNLNRGSHVKVEIVPDIKIIQTESSPKQTYLPEFFFLSNLRVERDSDTETQVNIVVSGEKKNDIVGTPYISEEPSRALEFLSLSGCYQITDVGLNYLSSNGGLPRLKHLDLSGCLNVAGEAVSGLVKTAPYLDPAQLFYCDNILDGPYADTASGCQNLQCNSRVCCRCGE
ncbi:F-box/LRR-repeat protein 5-like [Mercenaria mercenaria]|uniref:F-box/LRR-repeat protein 5-like n=1 Tax=Mercenaria mercenaria TaxID=6596 RepID=UPI00234F9CF5|nr:F-box/LRR-repeat protein 5-like [Mercenaria mercenaria]